ncbi:MAG TPA: YlmH/Sll1252 family protein [Candidatus Limnocylindrales bacterium]|nr:YlmH/Sll1252 family protein [Candidatus Limnocylindrales bacterium]
MVSMPPLTEGEKQWQQNFERKLLEVDGRKTYSTAFLDPRQFELAKAELQKRTALSYTVYGGYPDAERNSVHVFPAEHQGLLSPVTAVMVKWADTSSEIGHRDILGAVLATGVRRDQVGDILLLKEGGAVIMVLTPLADYICSNLCQIGPLQVECSEKAPGQLSQLVEEGKEIHGTVASLRLDSVLSVGFGISRSRLVLLIKGGLVRVNWRPVDSPSYKLHEGDQLSLKGRGRLLLHSVEGETRKGRIRVKLKKYS